MIGHDNSKANKSYPYIHETSMTTSIISQHSSYDCISTGALNRRGNDK